jgi:ubiquinone/menaquinone biosynthesis C-methylase UbiE
MPKMRGDAGIYGPAAKWYDKNSRKSRLAELKKYADAVAGRAPKGGFVLEVAPGPGYLSIELAKMGYAVTGVELSQDFVEIEKRNAAEAGVRVNFLQGNAAALPLSEGQFDFIICTAAFKNFKEPVTALLEMHRVLKPGGTALIIDMSHNITKDDIHAETASMKGFDKWFVKLSFRTFLSKSAYTKQEFEGFIAASPFESGEVSKDGLSLYAFCRKGSKEAQAQ